MGNYFDGADWSALADAVRGDGWQNFVTGLGTRQRDKGVHSHFSRPDLPLTMNWEVLSNLYHFDDIAQRIVDTWPEHMFQCGWELAIKDAKDQKQSATAQDVEKYAQKLKMATRLLEGVRWGRLYGGAIAIIGAIDGRTSEKPLNEQGIQSINYINVIDRRYVTADTYYSDPLAPNYGEPAVYRISASVVDPRTNPNSTAIALIHESRVLRFEGAPCDVNERRRLAGWSHSVLQAPYDKMQMFVNAFQASGHLLNDASQGVFKLDGLVGMISSNPEALQTRMQLIDMARSVARAVLLDKDGEEFTRVATSFAGLPDMLDRFMMLLSAATGIPVAILMGRSAAGLNATGDSDFRAFYGQVANRQTNWLAPQLQKLYRLISLAKDGPTKGAEKEFAIKFRPLWQPTAKEIAETNNTQAQADVAYINAGVLSPEEVALSRFRDPGTVNLTTTIDVEAREASLKEGVKFDPHPNEPDPTTDPADPNESEPNNAAAFPTSGGPGSGTPDGTKRAPQ